MTLKRGDMREELNYIPPPNRKLPPVPGSQYNTCDRIKRGKLLHHHHHSFLPSFLIYFNQFTNHPPPQLFVYLWYTITFITALSHQYSLDSLDPDRFNPSLSRACLFQLFQLCCVRLYLLLSCWTGEFSQLLNVTLILLSFATCILFLLWLAKF